MPDPLTVLAGLLSGGPDKLVGHDGRGRRRTALRRREGRPLVSVEAPLLVQVAGEAERLLGAAAPPVPFWWTEARATTGVEEAERLAGTFAARVTSLTGGSAWPPEAARSLAVVKTDGVSVAPTPAAAQPAVDVLTDKVAVIIQDRPVVAMTAWLSDAFRAAADAELGLQIVTSPGRRPLPGRPQQPERLAVALGRAGRAGGLLRRPVRAPCCAGRTACSPRSSPPRRPPRTTRAPQWPPPTRSSRTRASVNWSSPSARSTPPTTGWSSAAPWRRCGAS